jgi:hypothetical protein
MRTRFAAIALIGAALSAAFGENVIRQWGEQQHIEDVEYRRVYLEGYGYRAVEIIENLNPDLPWRFEAWDTQAGEEGVIASITIVSPEPVSGLDLRIAPDPDSPYGTHPYGAANMKQIDLVTNGDAGNWLTTLLLKYDYGDATQGGTLHVGKADTIQIGGNAVAPAGVDAINITGWISGPVSIGGNVVSPVNLPMISGQCTIWGDILAPVTLGVVWGDLTLEGAITDTGSLCWDVNGGDVNLNWSGVHDGEISFSAATGGHTVRCSGSLSQLTIQTIKPGALVQVDGDVGTVDVHQLLADEQVGGTLAVAGDVGSLNVGGVGPLGAVYVGGAVAGGLAQSVGGDITLDALTGTLTVEAGLSGRAYVRSLSGTLDGHSFTGSLAADEVTPSGRLTLTGGQGGVRGSVMIKDLAGIVRVGDPYGDEDPMSAPASITVTGEVTGKILLNMGFGAGAVVNIVDASPGDWLFIVNADGANPRGRDCWEGGLVRIGGVAHSYPDFENLWVVDSCVKGDASGDGVLNGYDIDPFVQMLADPGAYCQSHPELCGGWTLPDGASFVYRGDLDCSGEVNGYDIDPFVLKMTNPGPTGDPENPGWYDLYPSSCDAEDHAECCTPCGSLDGPGAPEDLSAEAAGDGSPESVAQFIVDSASLDTRPALLALATQMAAELPDPERAALWAEVAALLGE